MEYVTGRELDEIYEEAKERRKSYDEDCDCLGIRECVKEILEMSGRSICGKSIKCLIIIINTQQFPSDWNKNVDDCRIYERDFGKFNVKEQEYFIELLEKYFVVEKIAENRFKLTLK